MIKKQINITQNGKGEEHTLDVILIIATALGAVVTLIYTVFFG
jgi:hypothetical protein